MISMLIRVVLLQTTRLFYREIAVSGAAMPSGPVVVVANHPNGLVDPLMVRLALDHPVKGMAKSTLFKNPVSKTVMQAFDSLPVYRRVDGEDTGKNASMFSACQECLEEGGALMIFPEGVSHDATELLPLKTGAARIALGAESDNRYELGVRILPVGLIYEDKAIFRSRVAVVVGEPLEIEAFKERHEEEPYEAAKELTHEIAQALSSVMLEADDSELWTGFLAVASWMNEDALDAMDERQGRARELASGFRWLQEHDPATAQKLVDEVRGFAQMFEAVGVENPLDLERVEVRTSRVVGAALWLLVLAPFALLGAILGWLPYRLIRPLSFAIARGELDVVSSIKAMRGAGVYAADVSPRRIARVEAVRLLGRRLGGAARSITGAGHHALCRGCDAETFSAQQALAKGDQGVHARSDRGEAQGAHRTHRGVVGALQRTCRG